MVNQPGPPNLPSETYFVRRRETGCGTSPTIDAAITAVGAGTTGRSEDGTQPSDASSLERR